MTNRFKIYVAGHRGMVGSAIVRQRQALGCHIAGAPRNDAERAVIASEMAVIASEARQSMPPADIITRTHAELELTNQTTQPDGAPRKLMDSSRLNALGWQAKVDMEQGLALAYQDYLGNGERQL